MGQQMLILCFMLLSTAVLPKFRSLHIWQDLKEQAVVFDGLAEV